MLGLSLARFGIASRSANSSRTSRLCWSSHLRAVSAIAAGSARVVPVKTRLALASRISVRAARLMQFSRATIDFFPRFRATAEMFGEKFLYSPVKVAIVFRPGEAVTFVRINDVKDFAVCAAQCLDHG